MTSFNDPEKSQGDITERLTMKKIMLRDDFLKLYFDRMGVNDSLVVKRLSNYSNMSSSEEKFRFAIMRSRILPSKNEDQLDKEVENVNVLSKEKVKRLNAFLMYPKNYEEFDDSLNFLSLAFSGFSTLDKNTKLFEPDPFKKKNTAYLHKFIQKLKKENSESEKKTDFNLLHEFLISDKEITKEHNKIIDEICQDRLEKIHQIKSEENLSNSLFFLKDSVLYEYRPHQQKVYEIKKNVADLKLNETLLEYIEKVNNDNENSYKFLPYITIFSELNKMEEEEVTTSNKGEILIMLVLSLIFIFNFFFVVPQSNFKILKSAFTNLFEVNEEGFNLVQNITSYDGVKSFFNGYILDTLYNEDLNIFDYELTITNEEQLASQIITGEEIQPSNTTEIKMTPKSYYLLKSNFFSGLMVNFRSSERKNITDVNGFVKEVRQTTPGYFSTTPIQITQNFLSFDIQSNNPLYENTYELYFKPSMNPNQVYWLKNQLDLIFDKKLYDFSFTILIYNPDFDIVSVYSLQFVMDSYGHLGVNRYFNGFLPFVNKQPNTFMKLMIINVIWLILFIYVCFINVRNLTNNFIELIVNMNYVFEYKDWLDLFFMIISLVSQIMFYSLYLFNSNYFAISLSEFTDFTYWVGFSFKVKDYQRVTGICMLVIMFKIVRFLYDAYPNFGVVFQTLDKAALEFSSFMLVVCLCLVGIIMMAHNAFGWHSVPYADIESSIVTIYLMFLGMFNYWTSLYNDFSYNPIAPYFFIIFMFFFNLILINVFLCIIINNYFEVKEKKHMSNQAYALISADDTKDIYKRFFNLILFRNPIEVEMENKDEQNLDSYEDLQSSKENRVAKADENGREEIENKKTKGNRVAKVEQEDDADENGREEIENRKKKKESVGLWNTFIYHLERLKLREWFMGASFKKEEIIKRKKEKYQLIRKKNVQESLEELEINYEKEFGQLKDSACYILFIVIFVLMIFFQLRIGYPNSSRDYINEVLLEKIGNITNFKTFEEAASNIEIFILALYNYPAYYADYCEKNEIQAEFFNNYFFLNPPYLRITSRKYKFVSNPDTWKNSFFPVTLTDNNPFDRNNCGSISEFTDSISDQNSDFNGTLFIPYHKSGDWAAANACGGYIFSFNNYFPSCAENPTEDYVINMDYLLHETYGKNIASVLLDSVIFNKFSDFSIYFQLLIKKGQMGEILFEEDVRMIPINRYVTRDDFQRLVIEVIYYIFIIYYFVEEFKVVFALTKQELIKNYKMATENTNAFEKSSLLNKFIRFDINKYHKESGFSLMFKLVFDFITLIFKRILELAFLLIRSLVQYITKDYFNILDILSLLISFVMFIKWFDIIVMTGNLDLEYRKTPDSSRIPNIEIINILSEYYYIYNYWQSINVFVIFLRMVKYFRFSKSIYALISVLKRASSTLAFHIVIMMIIFIGFALWAYALYSINLNEFSSLEISVLSLLIIISGKGDDIDPMYEAEDSWTSIFLIIFTSFYMLILFNVLYAIVIESYEEIKYNQQLNMTDTKEANLFKNIWTILIEQKKLFFTTCNLYTDNIHDSLTKYVQNYYAIFKQGLKETEMELNSGKIGKKGCCNRLNNLNKLKLKFMSTLYEETSHIQKATLSGYSLSYYKHVFEKEKSKFNQKEEPVNVCSETSMPKETPANVSSEISILTKMMTYIYVGIIGHDEKDYFKKNFLIKPQQQVMHYKTSTNFQFLNNLNLDTDDQELLNANKDDKDLYENKYLDEYVKLYKLMLEVKKGNSFFKENLFDKYFLYQKALANIKDNNKIQESLSKLKVSTDRAVQESLIKNYRLSKELRNLSNFGSHDQIFCIENVNYDEIFNLVPRFHHHDEGKDINACGECDQLKEYFQTISLYIYDILVKNFYYPRNSTVDDREIFYAYYLFFYIKNYNTKDIKFLSKELPMMKKAAFVKEITFVQNLDVFCPFTLGDLKYKKGMQIDLVEEIKENCLLKTLFPLEDFNGDVKKYQIFKEQMKYYKLFTIWNTLYLILFEKNKSWTLNLRDKSSSYKLLSKNTNQTSNYKDFFLKQFCLTKRRAIESVGGGSFVESLLIMLKQYHLKYPNLLEDDVYEDNQDFFSDAEKFMLHDLNGSSIFNEIIPPKEKAKAEDRKEEYPFIFLTIWGSFLHTEKFILFFGYSHFLYSHTVTEELITRTTFYDNFKNFLDCDVFMKSPHQAQVLTMLKFPPSFLDAIKLRIRKAFEQNLIKDVDTLDDVQSIIGAFKFFTDLKTNYLIVYRIMQGAFDDYLKRPKEIVNQLNTKFNSNFKIFLSQNSKYMSEVTKKIEFVKFYELYLCKVKFYKLKDYFSSINGESNKSDQDDDEELGARELVQKANEDEALEELYNYGEIKDKEIVIEMKKEKSPPEIENEIFILALTLSQNDYMTVIGKIENVYLKEFFIMMFYYLHGDDPEYSNNLSYIKRKIKINLLEKGEKYSMYMKEKERVENQRHEYNEEKYFNKNAKEYNEKLLKEIENLYKKREALMKKADAVMAEQEKKNKEQ